MSEMAQIIQPSGEINRSTVDLLSREVMQFINKGVKLILIDFQDVISITCDGIENLYNVFKDVCDYGGEFYLCSLSISVSQVLVQANIFQFSNLLRDRREFKEKVLTEML